MFGIENISWNNFLCVSMPIALAIDGYFSYKCISKNSTKGKDVYTNKNDLANEEDSSQSKYEEPENATIFDDNYDDIPDMIQSVSENDDELFQLADELNAQSEVVSNNNNIDFEDVSLDIDLPEDSEDENKEETRPIDIQPDILSPSENITSNTNQMTLDEYETIGQSYNWN